ncbi:Structure-specific endonuclease subunit SLX4 [Brachionus plicatilis]|uniref:Structure-specific endonuclease subunit SLX4 n=1 Tax=Brachionus plicatilis TaxID=10195 RepID=A0A3M7QSC4_BRAPC|nr:Structure-specific endonuclease subunit SLX4 [Brachionus plicatilis]
MGTSLQFLHQNLYQLRDSKLLENEMFKELYYEAKGHEKQANLTNLASRSKNDKITQETNFYLILTNMLSELKEIEPNSYEFKKKLEKIYKWYCKNKESFSRNEKNKAAMLIREAQINQSARRSANVNHDFSERVTAQQTTRSNRDMSPVYFPSLKSAYKIETGPKNKEIRSKNKLSDETRSELNKSSLSNRSEKNQKPIETKNLMKSDLDEKSRGEILKALSIYADQLYSSIDKTDTKKLEQSLKSLSKFYNALNDSSSLNVDQAKDTKSSVTLNSLIEVAKEVSDRMILSKNQLNMRINENRQLLESLKNSAKNPAVSEKSFFEKNETFNDNSETESKFLNAPVYAVLTRDTSKRPKSTSFTDWRGYISRPSTGRKTRSPLKFNLSSSSPRPKSSISITQIEITDSKEKKIFQAENDQNEEELSEKLKRQRSFSRQKNQPKESTSSCSEGREVKYVTFVAKINEKSSDGSSTENAEKIENLKDKSNSQLATTEPIIQQDTKQSESVTDNTTETATIGTEKALECLHREIDECECCKYPRAPSPSFVNQKHDIFHLTYVNNEKNEFSHRKNLNSLATETVSDQDQTSGLREILLSNYDPKFAAKIGISEFVPVQIMTPQNNGQLRNLEFIPFENIDSSYPKVNGFPVFDPYYNKQPAKLYRTNPSIPRPESKYGTRSSVYEQILEMKRKDLDTSALNVWQPEDVNLVRDLLELEQAPIRDTLVVEGLKPDIRNENYELVGYKVDNEPRKQTNTQTTPMGRPINMNIYGRWNRNEEINENKDEENTEENYKCPSNTNFSTFTKETLNSDVAAKPKSNGLQLTGNQLCKKFDDYVYEGRPLPTARTVRDPEKEQMALMKFNDAKQSVHIPTIFKGTTYGRNYVKEFDLEEIAKREDQRMAAIKIQRHFREHLLQKHRIANRSDPDALARVINYRNELLKRKQIKEALMMEEKSRIEKENARLRTLIQKIGIHSDLYQILHQKGPEYTSRVLNKAASCIQRWVRGWMIRKEIKNFKLVLYRENVDWSSFTTNYRKTILRILKMRNSFSIDCEFIPNEALDFYLREKKYTSYFNKLAFSNEIELSDISKMFNFVDLHPNNDEIQEAKLNVLKFYKRKANSTSISKRAMFDIIYYIYPPKATKLKSTRKSTWTNPIVDGEDALRLRGFKLIEPTVLEKSWKLVSENSVLERMNSNVSLALNKNTPVQDFEDSIN